jgi:hypothetical protein
MDILALGDPGRVEERGRDAVQVDALGNHVTSRPGDLGHDRPVGAQESVEQARLPGVGPANDRDLDTLAIEQTAPGSVDDGSERVTRRVQCWSKLDRWNLVVGEVGGGVEVGQRFNEAVASRTQPLGQPAAEFIDSQIE